MTKKKLFPTVNKSENNIINNNKRPYEILNTLNSAALCADLHETN